MTASMIELVSGLLWWGCFWSVCFGALEVGRQMRRITRARDTQPAHRIAIASTLDTTGPMMLVLFFFAGIWLVPAALESEAMLAEAVLLFVRWSWWIAPAWLVVTFGLCFVAARNARPAAALSSEALA